MTTHPNSIDLEAFACGENIAVVAAHVEVCTACMGFVNGLRGALSTGPSKEDATAAVARAASRATVHTPRRWWAASTIAVPLAAAAVLLLVLRTPSTRDALVPVAITPTATTGIGAGDPDTVFKGGRQVAVIRERAGQQTRLTQNVAVRPGDRIRVEVALDREQAILAAVLGDDGSWLELMPAGVRQPGTHFSERSARVDASPMRGTIFVGTPEAVRRARATKRVEDVSTIRVDWEGP